MLFANPFKRERPSHPGVYRNAAFLSQCSERAAHDWLKNRTVKYKPLGQLDTPVDSHVLEYILYRRNMPLIDLALAEHGQSQSVLERVFRRGHSFTRVVACANPSLFVGELVHQSIYRKIRKIDDINLLWRIVRRGSLAELRAVCENPNITTGFYEALIDCWEGHEESRFASERRVSSDRFKHILLFLARNPRLSVPYKQSKERYSSDVHAEDEYTNFFTRCWQLAQVVPVEPEWAYALAELYKQLHRPYDIFDDVEAVLDRWRPADENLGAVLDKDRPSPFPKLRERIAAKFVKPSIEMSNSDDQAIRYAFYSTFDPERPEFRDLDWTEWLEREDSCRFWLSGNENIWRSALGRSNLRSLTKSHDILEVGSFDQLGEEYRKAHPEWFDVKRVASAKLTDTVKERGDQVQRQMMNQPNDPVEKRHIDDAVTTIMVHTADQVRQFLNGILTTALILIVAFLLAGVWAVLIALAVMRILQHFHPSKKAAEAFKKQYLSR